MMILNIKGKEYKIKFGYNSFCDTDLMDRVNKLTRIIGEGNAKTDSDVAAIGMIKDLFCVVRDLIFVGLKKHNPVESAQDVGDLLDDYIDCAPEGEKRGIFELFSGLANELFEEGFLADALKDVTESQGATAETPEAEK